MGCQQTGTTYFGAKFNADIRDRVPQSAFFFGVWEPNISHQLERRLRPGSLFVDVGSNFGYYSLLAAKLVGAAGDVVAIEASPSIFQRLCSNIERNGLTNVRCVNAAVSDRRGALTIYAGPSFNTGATSTIEAWRGGPAEAVVQALPLNEILTKAERARVRLIKIDVEGAELPILEQILATTDCYPTDAEIIVEFSPSGAADDWARVFSQFLSAGFAAFGIDNDYEEEAYLRWRTPCELQRLTAPPAMKTDILFTRNSQQAADAT